MVAAVSSSSTSTPLNSKSAPNRTPNRTKPRTPLLPSASDNSKNSNDIPRRSKSRDVPSRFLSTPCSSSASSLSASRRCPSPVGSRPSKVSPARAATSLASEVKRPQSAERRRPGATPEANGLNLRIGGSQNSNAQKMLITSSRSLSVSFQGESFSYHVSQVKTKPPSTSSSFASSTTPRKAASPERGRITPARSPGATDYARKVAAVELQQRWPGRLRHQLSSSAIYRRDGDLLDDRRVIGAPGMSLPAITPISSHSAIPTESRSRLESVDNWRAKSLEVMRTVKYDTPISSDVDSISSDGSGASASGVGQRVVNGKVIPARLWNEYNMRMRGLETPESPRSRTSALRVATPNRFGIDYHVSSPKGASILRGQMSPTRSRQSSPSKFGMLVSPSTPSSPIRGSSPYRARNGVEGRRSFDLSYSTDSMPSTMSFTVDIKRGKIGDSKLFEFHLLRILYNRLLQWRFVNARADAALQAQKLDAERSLCIAHKKTSKVLESVKSKRMELQQLRQNLKLISLLNDQMLCLDEFARIEQQYLLSLSGAVEALRASTLRLPVIGAARVDLETVNDAISSAVDVMQAMGSSICMLSTSLSEVNSRVDELSKVAAMERASLDRCRNLLSAVASLQVKEHSMRINSLQLHQVA